MSAEVLNKVGRIVSQVSAGNWGQALALYGVMSVAEQTVIALWHALLDDEDEWEKNGGWFGAMLGEMCIRDRVQDQQARPLCRPNPLAGEMFLPYHKGPRLST